MRLSILGSATYPMPSFPSSGYLIQSQQAMVWCDIGPGTWSNLGLFAEPEQITAIVISHRHLDHCADLLASIAFWENSNRPRSGVPLYAHEQTLTDLEKMAGGEGSLDYVFQTHPVAHGDHIKIVDLEVSFLTTDHPVETVASRWTDGERTLVYSADTGPERDWQPIADQADLFLCEATLQDDSEFVPHHLRASQAGQIASQQSVRTLMLTHIPTHLSADVSVAEAEAHFDGEVKLAVPGARHQI